MGKPPVQWGSGVPMRAMPVGLCVAAIWAARELHGVGPACL